MSTPVSRQPDAAPTDARRLLVLWVCWVLLAVFLAAAGVMSFA